MRRFRRSGWTIALLLFAIGGVVGIAWAPKVRAQGDANKITETLQGITFDSAYDNGSLAAVSATGDGVFDCTLFNEPGELGSRRYWFRFRLSGVSGRSIRLNIDHAENPRPFVRIGTGPWRRMTATEAPANDLVLLQFSANENEAEIAFFEPLGVEETDAEVDQLVASSDFASSLIIGTTEQGRAVRMVTVNDAFYPDAQKHRIWIHSRAHAGEVTSTHSMLGFLSQVLENSETGRRLREHCIFNIVPLLNIDGVFLGHTRWDSMGRDPERDWCNIRIPEVQALKDQVDAFMSGDTPIEVALNLHSTKGNFGDSFFYKHLSPSVSVAFEQIQQDYIDAFANATPLFANGNPRTSQLSACLFIESYFWNNWGDSVMALTHEGHFFKRITDNQWITGADYREIGAGLARGLLTYFPIPAAGEPDSTFAGWVMASFPAEMQSQPAIIGAEADPDGDGFRNLLEYGLGLDPLVAEATAIHFGLDTQSGAVVINFDRSAVAADLAWFVETSTDLEIWARDNIDNPVSAAVTETVRRSVSGRSVASMAITLSPGNETGSAYYRVAVESP